MFSAGLSGKDMLSSFGEQKPAPLILKNDNMVSF